MKLERSRHHLVRFRFTGTLWGRSYAFERPSLTAKLPSIGLDVGTDHHEDGDLSVFELGDAIDGFARPERLLRFPRRDPLVDGRLVELAESIAASIDRGDALAVEEAESEVRRLAGEHGEATTIDGVERGRLELVRHFDKPLYMRHFAVLAGVHEETFARKFSVRYGVTPVRYRTLVRLKEAVLLLTTRPELTVREVAKVVGFDDVAYFHRAFSVQFAMTPLALARAFSQAAVA